VHTGKYLDENYSIRFFYGRGLVIPWGLVYTTAGSGDMQPAGDLIPYTCQMQARICVICKLIIICCIKKCGAGFLGFVCCGVYGAVKNLQDPGGSQSPEKCSSYACM